MSRWPYNTAQWQGLRSAKLSEQPLCEACLRLEIVTPAYAVDHIEAIVAGGDPFPPLVGLMALCEACHNSKTNAKDHPNAHGFRRALKGYDVDGNPIDPEGWDEPGADRSRGSRDQGPAGDTRVDLVLQAVRNKEADLWV